jgi:hypothetical protein
MSMSFDNTSIDLAELGALVGPLYAEYGVQPPTGGFDVSLPTRIDEPSTTTEQTRESILAEQMRLDREFESQQRELQAQQRRQNAFTTIQQILSTYGLDSLSQFLWDEIIVKETVNIDNPDAIIFALRGQPAYQERFAANAARARAGLPELDPGSYLQLEEQYRELMRSNGLPLGFYDQAEDFRAFIENDISPAELNERVQQGYRAVSDADPAVKRQMQQLYGVSEGELVAYFLDPQRTAPILTRQARAAQIAARGQEQAGIQLTGTLAEDLARRGITEQEAQRGFAEIGALGELRQAFAGEQEISEEQLVGGQFGVNIQAQQELERRRRQRVAAFQGGGSFARTTGATSGSIRTGVGEAE